MFCFGQFNANLKYLAKTSIKFSWWEYTPKCWIFPSHSSFPQWIQIDSHLPPWIRWPSWPTAGPYSTNLWRSQWIGFATGKSTGNHLGSILWRMVSHGILWYPMISYDIPWYPMESVDGNKNHHGVHTSKDEQRKRSRNGSQTWGNMQILEHVKVCQRWGSIQDSITSIIMIIMIIMA